MFITFFINKSDGHGLRFYICYKQMFYNFCDKTNYEEFKLPFERYRNTKVFIFKRKLRIFNIFYDDDKIKLVISNKKQKVLAQLII